MDGGDVRRGFHHAVQLRVLTDGVDAVIHGLQGGDEAAGHGGVDDRLGLGALHRPDHLCVGHVELVFHLSAEDVPVGLHLLLHIVGHGDDEHAVAGDGVVQLARMELGQLHALIALPRLIEEAAQQLDGVGTLLVDVVARVSARESLQLGTQEELTGAGSLTLKGELRSGVAATGARDENLALVLRIQIDEVVARHESALHALGTAQSRLLVASEDAL